MCVKIKGLLAANLIRIRQQKQFSQFDIAMTLGISQPAYNRIESGKSQISTEGLFKLSAFYKLPVDAFFCLKSAAVKSSKQLAISLLEEKLQKLGEKVENLKIANQILTKRSAELEKKLSVLDNPSKLPRRDTKATIRCAN